MSNTKYSSAVAFAITSMPVTLYVNTFEPSTIIFCGISNVSAFAKASLSVLACAYGKIVGTSGVISPPSTGGVISPPSTGGVISPPSAGGVISHPSTGGVISPPSTGGVISPPYTGGVISPPSTGGVISPPSTGGVISGVIIFW